MSKIIDRIKRSAGVANLAGILADKFSPTDLQSLMLEVYRRRSQGRTPADVLADYQNNRFVQPAAVSPRALLAWRRLAFELLPEQFQLVTLSPVSPLGANSVVAPVDQNWAVSTARNSEVVSDSTNVLALECAVQRRELMRRRPKSGAQVHLAAAHRLLRAQKYDDPLLKPHFDLLALASAGRAGPGIDFELAGLKRHIRFYLDALSAYLELEPQLRLTVSDFSPKPRIEQLKQELLTPLLGLYDSLSATYDESRSHGRGYYRDLCFHIFATTRSGVEHLLVDGGSVDWTHQYLGSAKERLITSGIGDERLCTEY